MWHVVCVGVCTHVSAPSKNGLFSLLVLMQDCGSRCSQMNPKSDCSLSVPVRVCVCVCVCVCVRREKDIEHFLETSRNKFIGFTLGK